MTPVRRATAIGLGGAIAGAGAPPLAPTGYESDMPGFGDKLGDAEIWAIIAFIKSRWPAEIRSRQPREPANASP